jgi:hypothetical protein
VLTAKTGEGVKSLRFDGTFAQLVILVPMFAGVDGWYALREATEKRTQERPAEWSCHISH